MSLIRKETIIVENENYRNTFHGYIPELSVHSFLFKRKILEENEQKNKSSSIYDQIFHSKSHFNPKARRDDREYWKFNRTNEENKEKEKSFLSRSSSEYGRRHQQYIHSNEQSHRKIDHVKNDFYRNNGIPFK